MSDDLRTTLFEVDDDEHLRWLAAAESDGLSIEEWLRWLANGRAAALEHRVEGAWPEWWQAYRDGSPEDDA